MNIYLIENFLIHVVSHLLCSQGNNSSSSSGFSLFLMRVDKKDNIRGTNWSSLSVHCIDVRVAY